MIVDRVRSEAMLAVARGHLAVLYVRRGHRQPGQTDGSDHGDASGRWPRRSCDSRLQRTGPASSR